MTFTFFLVFIQSFFGQSTDTFYVAGDLLKSESGKVAFVSEAPLETIKASSTELKGVIDVNSKKFAFQLAVNSFEGFNSPLQRIHFLENYIEAYANPVASFEGKIVDPVDFEKPGTYQVRTKGSMRIKGIEVERIIPCEVIVAGNEVSISSSFDIELDDYNIRIPRIVNQKISETIAVDVSMTMR